MWENTLSIRGVTACGRRENGRPKQLDERKVGGVGYVGELVSEAGDQNTTLSRHTLPPDNYVVADSCHNSVDLLSQGYVRLL